MLVLYINFYYLNDIRCTGLQFWRYSHNYILFVIAQWLKFNHNLLIFQFYMLMRLLCQRVYLYNHGIISTHIYISLLLCLSNRSVKILCRGIMENKKKKSKLRTLLTFLKLPKIDKSMSILIAYLVEMSTMWDCFVWQKITTSWHYFISVSCELGHTIYWSYRRNLQFQVGLNIDNKS